MSWACVTRNASEALAHKDTGTCDQLHASRSSQIVTLLPFRRLDNPRRPHASARLPVAPVHQMLSLVDHIANLSIHLEVAMAPLLGGAASLPIIAFHRKLGLVLQIVRPGPKRIPKPRRLRRLSGLHNQPRAADIRDAEDLEPSHDAVALRWSSQSETRTRTPIMQPSPLKKPGRKNPK